MSRRLRYGVAVSLDGFIAGPNGEHDWIVMDPSIDFAAMFKEYDTAVMGRKTYEVLTAQGGNGALPGLDVVVFSRTLDATAYPGVRIVKDDPCEVVAALKARPGRDIWLYGGGTLFRSLLDAGLVDTVEIALIPVLLGAGVPLLPSGAPSKLVLADHRTLPASGIVALCTPCPAASVPLPAFATSGLATAGPGRARIEAPVSSSLGQPCRGSRRGKAQCERRGRSRLRGIRPGPDVVDAVHARLNASVEEP
jgi:dihydrofolate reductase